MALDIHLKEPTRRADSLANDSSLQCMFKRTPKEHHVLPDSTLSFKKNNAVHLLKKTNKQNKTGFIYVQGDKREANSGVMSS